MNVCFEVERGRALPITTLALLLWTAGAVAQTPAPSSPQPTGGSWTSDLVEVREGDLVTILIDEYTVASANRDEVAAKQRDRDVSVQLPIGGGGFRSRNDVGRRTLGESARRERFQAEITARIVEVLPGGAVRIEGTKRVQIDDHDQTVTVRGLVRTSDITVANTVDSWRVANAELLYDSNGSLGETGGIWSTILDLIIP